MTEVLVSVPAVASTAVGGQVAPRPSPAPQPVRRSASPEPGSPQAETTPTRDPSTAEAAMEEVRRRMNDALDQAEAKGYLRRTSVRYEFTESGSMIIKVMDSRTDKLVRMIPPEEQLAFARGLERYFGLLIDRQG